VLRALLDLVGLGHRWQRLKYAFAVCLQQPTLYPLDVHPGFDADLCVDTFLRNHATLHLYGTSQGGRVLTCLQPFNGIGGRPVTHADVQALAYLGRRISVDGTNEMDAMRTVYQRLAAEFARRADPAFVDLTPVFDATRSQVYIDQVHCSDVGYDLIARGMADRILASAGLTPKDGTP
jgi:hypothetical protein